MNFLGIDPDLNCLTLAITDRAGQIVDARAFKSKATGLQAIKELIPLVGQYLVFDCMYPIRAIAVEGQEIVYAARQGRNPRSLLPLAHMTGALHGLCMISFPEVPVFIPAPAKWKGQVPKGIHHARILKRLGVEYKKRGGKEEYCVPADAERFPDLNPGDWKHAMDSWGLAIWAKEQYKKDHQYEF